MQQRDFIKDQIEQLGRVLGKLVDRFLDLKATGKVSQAISISIQQLQSELDIDTTAISNMAPAELKNYLLTRNFTETHIDQLARYFFELGRASKEKEATGNYLITAKSLLVIVDDISDTFTFERNSLRTRIELEIRNSTG